MTLTVDATYENGVLRPEKSLPFKEHEKVRISIETATSPIMQAYGIIGWKGDHATLARFALDPELDPQEGP